MPILMVRRSAMGIAIRIAQSKALRRENAELCSAQTDGSHLDTLLPPCQTRRRKMPAKNS
jgi:hypothetical protein